MKAAIMNFAGLKGGNKMMILGDMLELGDNSINEHRKIIDLVRRQKIEDVYLVGKRFSLADEKNIFRHFEDAEEARDHFMSRPKSGYFILIKGSRGIKLEKTVEAF
jgi:UDP-N-acetylmuramoyl-tripeptide--D-alanyl-D-alanine ligase